MASTYLTKTFSSAGSRRTWTYSFWVKRGTLVQNSFFNEDGASNSNIMSIQFNSSSDLEVWDYHTSGYNYQLITDRKFRDTSAWYHIVVAVDTTQATSSDRVKIYVNGVQETSFSTETYPSQNFDCNINGTDVHSVGAYYYSGGSLSAYHTGSMTHVHFIDGTQYAASDFGETDSTTGIWKPKTEPSVTYGTNGFFLKFENSSAFGTDSSGNTNTFTVNGTMTQTIDTPSNVFATANPLAILNNNSVANLANGNNTTTGISHMPSTLMPYSDTNSLWYYEYKVISGSSGGKATAGGWSTEKNMKMGSSTWAASNTLYLYSSDGEIYTGSWTSGSSAATYTNGDIIGCLLDLNNSEIKWYKNGTLQYTLSSITPDGEFLFPWVQNTNASTVMSTNFGNGYFQTTAVSSANSDPNGLGIFEYDTNGGYAVCTKNINEQEYS